MKRHSLGMLLALTLAGCGGRAAVLLGSDSSPAIARWSSIDRTRTFASPPAPRRLATGRRARPAGAASQLGASRPGQGDRCGARAGARRGGRPLPHGLLRRARASARPSSRLRAARTSSWPRFAASGSFAWALSGSGIGINRGLALALAPGGDLILAGDFNAELSLGSITLVSKGGSDVFVARLSPRPGQVGRSRAGGVGTDYATAVAFGGGGIYVSGAFFDAIQLRRAHTAAAPGQRPSFRARLFGPTASPSGRTPARPPAGRNVSAVGTDRQAGCGCSGSSPATLELAATSLRLEREARTSSWRGLQPDGQVLWATAGGGVADDTPRGMGRPGVFGNPPRKRGGGPQGGALYLSPPTGGGAFFSQIGGPATLTGAKRGGHGR